MGGASRTVDAEQRAPEADARQQSRADERGRRADNQHDRHDEPIPAQCTLPHACACTSGSAQLERNSACAQTRARTQWRSASPQTRSTFLQCRTGTADGIPGGMVSRAAIGGATRRALRTERIRAYAPRVHGQANACMRTHRRATQDEHRHALTRACTPTCIPAIATIPDAPALPKQCEQRKMNACAHAAHASQRKHVQRRRGRTCSRASRRRAERQAMRRRAALPVRAPVRPPCPSRDGHECIACRGGPCERAELAARGAPACSPSAQALPSATNS